MKSSVPWTLKFVSSVSSAFHLLLTKRPGPVSYIYLKVKPNVKHPEKIINILTGKVLKPLKSVNPTQSSYQGLIEYRESTSSGSPKFT